LRIIALSNRRFGTKPFERRLNMSRVNEPQGQQGSTTGNLRETASEVGQNLRNLGSQVREQAGEQFDQMRQQANDYYEQGRQRAMEMEQSLEEYVQEKPIQALLIAAGVGMLLGLLWKRS
jgi:ElaB/YqjD/DUF883 family membrane-anchored ribosome-binding protein